MKRNIKLKQSFKNLNGEPRVNSLSAYVGRNGYMIAFIENGPNKKASIGLNKTEAVKLKEFIESWLVEMVE